jgi:hypothetical protein
MTGKVPVSQAGTRAQPLQYKGDAGMQRWVGPGVVADNLITIGRAREKDSVQ